MPSSFRSGSLRIVDHEWYRAWRHKELADEARAARDVRFRRREAVKRVLGDAMIVAAIVAFAWSMMPI